MELEVTLRELISKGGCSHVLLAWCERGQQAEKFLMKLHDLGTVRTAFRERDSKYSYLTRRQGKLVNTAVEFGVSILSVHSHLTEGRARLGIASQVQQRLALHRARLAAAMFACLGRCRTAEQVRAQDRTAPEQVQQPASVAGSAPVLL